MRAAYPKEFLDSLSDEDRFRQNNLQSCLYDLLDAAASYYSPLCIDWVFWSNPSEDPMHAQLRDTQPHRDVKSRWDDASCRAHTSRSATNHGAGGGRTDWQCSLSWPGGHWHGSFTTIQILEENLKVGMKMDTVDLASLSTRRCAGRCLVVTVREVVWPWGAPWTAKFKCFDGRFWVPSIRCLIYKVAAKDCFSTY
jgi:hypothetical protein